jgi:hypothetical protein
MRTGCWGTWPQDNKASKVTGKQKITRRNEDRKGNEEFCFFSLLFSRLSSSTSINIQFFLEKERRPPVLVGEVGVDELLEELYTKQGREIP